MLREDKRYHLANHWYTKAFNMIVIVMIALTLAREAL